MVKRVGVKEEPNMRIVGRVIVKRFGGGVEGGRESFEDISGVGEWRGGRGGVGGGGALGVREDGERGSHTNRCNLPHLAAALHQGLEEQPS